MCYRRERIKVGVVLVVAAMMIGGMSQPVTAQTEPDDQVIGTKDLNDELFKKLERSGKLDTLAEELGIDVSMIDGVDFAGELRVEAFSLGNPYNVKLEEVNVQEMSAKNCGTVADTVHLAVTNTKNTTHEVSYSHTWGGSIGYSIKWGTKIFGTEIEQSLSLAAEYAYNQGGSDSTTTSTSWEQGIDVLIQPHQIVPVTFIAKRETADRDFEQTFTVYGTTNIQLKVLSPFNIVLERDDGETQPYPSDEGNGIIDFLGNDLGDRVVSVWREEGPENYDIRVELYEHPNNSGGWWVWESSRLDQKGVVPEEWENKLSSMRIIDLELPYACIYYDTNYMGDYHRCFNVGQHEWTLVYGSLNDHVHSVEIVGNIKVTLCENNSYGGECKEYTESQDEVGIAFQNIFSSIKVESLSPVGEAVPTFFIQDYLPETERQFTLKGTYHRVGMMTGWFEKGVATRADYYHTYYDSTDEDGNPIKVKVDGCCEDFGDASPDCEPQFWCDDFPNAPGCGQVNVFSVFIKTKGSGTGTIRLNGVDRGTDFAISYTLDTIPALHKLEAIPNEFSTFAGWETATGTQISVGDQPYTPLPGETIYAVFDL